MSRQTDIQANRRRAREREREREREKQTPCLFQHRVLDVHGVAGETWHLATHLVSLEQREDCTAEGQRVDLASLQLGGVVEHAAQPMPPNLPLESRLAVVVRLVVSHGQALQGRQGPVQPRGPRMLVAV